MTFFQKSLDHFHDSLCPTLTSMKVDWVTTVKTTARASRSAGRESLPKIPGTLVRGISIRR
jgi:hypothetical protein